MQNTKLGGFLVSDIRPEKIETFEEVNTVISESGESQQEATEHKSVDLHPVLNGKLEEKGWLRTHAGAVWYNAKQKISVLQKIDNIIANIGTLSTLLTEDKSSLVAAINEQYSKIDTISLNSRVFVEFYYAYQIGSYIKFNPISPNGYFAIIIPSWHTINSTYLQTNFVEILPTVDNFRIQMLFKSDGASVPEGIVDIAAIFIPKKI